MPLADRKDDAQSMVSIIIPCYNAGSFVPEAIQSALEQTYPHTEIIVVDDGSTDGSLDVIRSFESRVRWISGPNRGGCAARNRGIALARGDFVQFLDADDILYPGKLERQVPVAGEHGSRITYTDHRYCPERGSANEIRTRPVMDDDPFVFVLQHRTLHTAGPIYRLEWLKEIGGFREGLPHSQEFEMNLRLAAHLARRGGRFVHIPEVHFEVRRRAGSVSSNTARTLGVKAQYLPPIVDDLQRQGQLTVHRREELAGYAASIGRQCIRGGRVSDGLSLIRFADSLDRRSANARAWGMASRLVKRLAGPLVAERVALWKRNWINHRSA